MNLAQALQRSAHILNVNYIEDSPTEARMLLGHATNLSPVQLYSYPEQILSPEEEEKLQALIRRRLRHEPSAYILKRKEFYGIDFYVDARVLIPRPETETLVEAAIEFANQRLRRFKRPLLIADIGTGCGAIAVCLALNLPGSKIYATDLSVSALEVARLNCQRHKVTEQVRLLHGDLLKPLSNQVDLIVANLPYIRNSELLHLSPEVGEFEPKIALDGGESGLDCIRKLLEQVNSKAKRGGCFMVEIGQDQQKEVGRLIHNCLNEVNFTFIPDLNGINRIAKINFQGAQFDK